jgi:predicted RNA-binding Zn ribbon-like protein
VSQSADSRRSFKLIGGHVVLDFINTLDDRFAPDGPVELLNCYEDLLIFLKQSKILSPGEARSLSRFDSSKEATRVLAFALQCREALARIFYGVATGHAGDEQDLEVPQEVLQRAFLHRKIRRRGKAFTWQWTEVESDPSAPLWLIAYEAVELLTSSELSLLKQCGVETCRWLYLDTSKNHSRRWCDMKICGNRTKAQRYYSRRSRAESGSDA